MKAAADNMPFDILTFIFNHYSEYDTPYQPVETLLLVCKTWHNWATNNPKLWSKFNIILYDTYHTEYWASCIPRRLQKCPSSTLLDITITSEPTLMSFRDCKAAFEALRVKLVGEHGELARRWRSFVLEDVGLSQKTVAQYLQFPTPKLEEFECRKLQSPFAVLPDTSSLRTFKVSWLRNTKLPSLENVTNLRIGIIGSFDENALASATNVVRMSIRSWDKPFRFVATYPQLKKLELEGEIGSDCLKNIQAPQLKKLTLRVGRGSDYLHVISSKGINLATLSSIRIMWRPIRHNSVEDIADYLHGVKSFLAGAINLETLVLENAEIAYLVLKLLTDDLKSLYQDHTLRIVQAEYEIELGDGEERLPSVNRLRAMTGGIPDCSWERLFELLNDVSEQSSSDVSLSLSVGRVS
ncbi:hypothetical protein M408DRAFT_230325 [Serendipita vermifera MAFF 305830]|uniref:F-box domain-containing protein n=1 Tax=Serendipita vermifera MAFF 305830 TaxID=933852 RepID=A0A0C3AJB9_SERVB|nr:hypothetical protein M408DRAFT_230325 [Serendipita vermifera MAFF 305830]